ncbi:hypothetical protein CR513_41738, partial [Mucuna pruriens]
MESPIYCRVSTTLNGERIALMLGDYFKVTFRVAHHSMARGVDRLEYYYPSLSVPCYGLIQEGRAFLRRLLLLLQFSTESLLDEMVEGIVSMVQYLFQYDVVTLLPPPLESQRRDIPLRVEIIVYDFDEELEIDDYFDMIPASDEAIKTSLKKSMVTKQEVRVVTLIARHIRKDLAFEELCNAVCPNRKLEYNVSLVVVWFG